VKTHADGCFAVALCDPVT